MVATMKLSFRRFDLALTHSWAIATDVSAGQVSGKNTYPVVFVDLQDSAGRNGVGEGAPSSQYQESWETVFHFLQRVDSNRLSFDDIDGSMAYLEGLPDPSRPAICAVNLALLDGASKASSQTLHAFLGLEFPSGGRISSFTIGLDTPEMIERKVVEAARYPILKMKLGSPADRENLAALRRAAPRKRVRVDANAAWKTKEEALARIEWLAADGAIEFVEQPMPATTPVSELAWLRSRSPLPLVGDESYQGSADAALCAEAYHGVNVKLVKTGGVTAGKAALEAARSQGLKTMLGCMIESSVLISAAAHLASLTDWLDLDGNVLITNDPYRGVGNVDGRMEFEPGRSLPGLGVVPI
jgi:L-alanine-DL-glutamate epimerase-like enolase superfamily enzyme